MKQITIFDFDGTLTSTDSMMAIIIFHRGRLGLAWALIRQIHLIILMLMGRYPNQKAKEHLLAYCFGGMTKDEFSSLCQHFAEASQNIMNPEMTAVLERAKEEGDTYIVTASPVEWVSLFANGVEVLGSKMEIVDGKITGRLIGKNCYGPEKVNRLLAAVPALQQHRNDYHVTAYGDSRGDREMLAFADKGVLIK